jgi:hypothetical protein
VSKPRIFLLVLVVALCAPAAAAASVTIGPSNPNPNPSGSQAINWPSGALLFTAAAPPEVQLTAPSDGVITSWLLYTDDVGSNATAQLRTLAPAGPKTYAVTGAGPVEQLAAITPTGMDVHNVLHTFSAQVPISAGQMVGVSLTRAAGSFVLPVLPAQSTGGWEYGCLGPGCASEVPTDGSPAVATQIKEQWLAMNARIEPDVDHDGYGDETQDPCVGTCPSGQAGTSPATTSTPPAATPVVQPKKCKKGKKLKRGKCVKKKHRKHKKPKK